MKRTVDDLIKSHSSWMLKHVDETPFLKIIGRVSITKSVVFSNKYNIKNYWYLFIINLKSSYFI